MVQAAITRVMEPWLAMGYAEKRRERFVFTTILALLANRNPHLEALTVATLEKLREKNPSPEMHSRIGQLHSVVISLHILPSEEWKKTANQPATPQSFKMSLSLTSTLDGWPGSGPSGSKHPFSSIIAATSFVMC